MPDALALTSNHHIAHLSEWDPELIIQREKSHSFKFAAVAEERKNILENKEPERRFLSQHRVRGTIRGIFTPKGKVVWSGSESERNETGATRNNDE